MSVGCENKGLGVAAATQPPGLRPSGVEPAAPSQAEPLVPNAAVTQADREAAAALYGERRTPNGRNNTQQRMREGKLDQFAEVQAFARHRLATIEAAWRAAWKAEGPQPVDQHDMGAFRYGRDCAVVAIRSLALSTTMESIGEPAELVTQADRNAAATYLSDPCIRSGRFDRNFTVQAFAAHRRATCAAAESKTLAALLQVVDSCGGVDQPDESADWSRGYNEALDAVERELKRFFARNPKACSVGCSVDRLFDRAIAAVEQAGRETAERARDLIAEAYREPASTPPSEDS